MRINTTCFIIIATLIATSAYANEEMHIKRPPDSIKEWYKPANKRQVWLHTMFSLRREMQAIHQYAEQNHLELTSRWIEKLDKDYRKIGDMVPEWKDEIKPRLLSELEMFANNGDTVRIIKTLEMIQRTCDDCHQDYQSQVAAMYRTPHYDEIQVKSINGNNQDFEANMEDLSTYVNQILIALEDGMGAEAIIASKRLSTQLELLGDSCALCHKDDSYPRERILGADTKQRLSELNASIKGERVKDSQKMMGEIAVTVCARCHNTHRIVNDLRESMLGK